MTATFVFVLPLVVLAKAPKGVRRDEQHADGMADLLPHGICGRPFDGEDRDDALVEFWASTCR